MSKQYTFNRTKPETRFWVSLVAGPLLLLLTLFLAPPEDMSQGAWYMVGIAGWMAVWWVSEVVPLPVTSLLPMVLAPLMGIASIKSVTAPFAHPLIYLFFGGFMLGMAMEHWNLHKRIALKIMLMTGSRPDRQIAGFMLATAFLSMWVSNTATTIMMLPIGLSVIAMTEGKTDSRSPFAKALLLGIAYSASIGGLATLIGTPPNALLAAFLEETYNIELGFAQWMLVGLPLSLIMLTFTWVWLTRMSSNLSTTVSKVDTQSLLRKQLDELGDMSRGEKTVGIIFLVTALAWMLRPLLKDYIPGISDTVIAIAAAVSLFVIPINQKDKIYVMSWEKARDMPWGILLLFGGGLALASLIKSTGLAVWVADSMSVFGGLPLLLVIGLVVTIIIFLTELTSNTATAAGFLPLLGALAISLGIDPILLAVPAALAASCAFMMPVATPPNAIVFGSGKLKIKDMMQAGLALNLVGIVVVTLLGYLLVSAVLIP